MNDVSPSVDPYQGYRALRDDAPICQLEAGGPWQISRHADVHQVLKDNAAMFGKGANGNIVNTGFGDPDQVFGCLDTA